MAIRDDTYMRLLPHQEQLLPLKKDRPMKALATFDIEATNWKDFQLIGFFDGEKYTRFDRLDDFIKHVLVKKYRNYLMFAHNMSYDGQFFVDRLKDYNQAYSITPILNGSRMLELKVKDKHKNVWKFRDSFGLLPSSLADLTSEKCFNVEHKKLDVDEKGMLSNPEYNRNDCIGLWEVLMKFREINGCQFGMTISQTSLMNFRMNYLNTPIQTVRDYEDQFRQAYHGGRVEVFKFNCNPDKKFFFYDVNSLYPYVMREFDYPIGKFYKSSPDIDKMGFTYAKVEDLPNYPILPEIIDNKMLFLRGWKEGWFTNQELRYLRDTTNCDMELQRSLLCDEFEPIFRTYVDDLYARRMEAKKTGNEAMSYTYKIQLNSLYGKFGEERMKEKIIINPQNIEEDMFIEYQKGGTYIIKKLEESQSAHIIPSIPAMVTANSRIYMHKWMNMVKPQNLYYMDTDSLITDIPIFEDSNQLGKFKLEAEIDQFYCFAPKVYTFRNIKSGKYIIKAKGLPFDKKQPERVSLGIFKDYLLGKTVINDRGLQTFKRAMKTASMTDSNSLLYRKSISRRFRSYYDKRKMVEDDDLDFGTLPFVQGDDRSVNQKVFGELMIRINNQMASRGI
jgi:hypothetical protein